MADAAIRIVCDDDEISGEIGDEIDGRRKKKGGVCDRNICLFLFFRFRGVEKWFKEGSSMLYGAEDAQRFLS